MLITCKRQLNTMSSMEKRDFSLDVALVWDQCGKIDEYDAHGGISCLEKVYYHRKYHQYGWIYRHVFLSSFLGQGASIALQDYD